MFKAGFVSAVALWCVALAYPHSEASSQSLGDRLRGAVKPDNPDIPAPSSALTSSAESDGDALNDPNAAAQAANDCIDAGEEESAAAIALAFGGGDDGGLASSDVSQYLVGLCIPADFESQYRLNDYLVTRGSLHSLFAGLNGDKLDAYLDEAGVETGIKTEALQNDGKIGAEFSASPNMDGAALLLSQNQRLAERVAALVPALAALRDDQRAIALPLAARTRAHAFNSSYFLARGVYVSQRMATAMAAQVKSDASAIGGRLRRAASGGDPATSVSDGASALGDARDTAQGTVVAFAEFVKKNGKALFQTLTSAAKVVQSFDTSPTPIPKLSQAETKADSRQLSEEWLLPAELEGEATFGASNTPSD